MAALTILRSIARRLEMHSPANLPHLVIGGFPVLVAFVLWSDMGKLRKAKWVLLPLLIFLATPALYIGVGCRGSSDVGSTVTEPMIDPEARARIDTMPDYRFREEDSYLSFPRWYIVHAAQDFAGFIGQSHPSGFAYFRAIADFWACYCAVSRFVAPRYHVGFSSNLVIYGTGISHTVEYLVKGIYENTVGRVSETLAPIPASPEDVFARRYAEDYGQWLNAVPWYEFPFFGRLVQFWETVPFSGSGIARKSERRFAMSSGLAVKSASSWLVKGASQTVQTPARLEIHALMRGLPLDAAPIDRRIALVETFRDGTQLVRLPRHQAFTEIVPKLAQTDATFLEIGGNSHMLILLSAPESWVAPRGLPSALFETRVLSGVSRKRVAVSVPVSQLLEIIRQLGPNGARLERLYDY